MEAVQYPYPIATRISISQDRRIRLPKFLRMSTPYALVEDTRIDQPWLGICGLDSLKRLKEEYDTLRVVAEYRTRRPTIPKSICDRFALLNGSAIWLVASGIWIEILPESAWMVEAFEVD